MAGNLRSCRLPAWRSVRQAVSCRGGQTQPSAADLGQQAAAQNSTLPPLEASVRAVGLGPRSASSVPLKQPNAYQARIRNLNCPLESGLCIFHPFGLDGDCFEVLLKFLSVIDARAPPLADVWTSTDFVALSNAWAPAFHLCPR